MKIAVLSDVHSNLEALDAVLEDIQAYGVDAIYCLGDTIGYGADPVICLQRIQDNCENRLIGNHEHALLHPSERANMNEVAQKAIAWTNQQFSAEEVEQIKQWPVIIKTSDCCLVHGSPDRPRAFYYLVYKTQIERALSSFSEKICFFGHTHTPALIEVSAPDAFQEMQLVSDKKATEIEQAVFELEEQKRYLINVGSVGQPRDGDQRARWVLLSQDTTQVMFRYVPYNIEGAQKKIHEAKLPSILAERLQYGK
jgi:predicted phosphodiesterase